MNERLKVRVRLTFDRKSEWSQVVEVPDDATDAELERLVDFWDTKVEADQYIPDVAKHSINYFEKLDGEEAAACSYSRGTEFFPNKATLATVNDEYAASAQVNTALRAHGLHTETDGTDVMFTLDGRKYRLELAPEDNQLGFPAAEGPGV